jgi:hypothetical protein
VDPIRRTPDRGPLERTLYRAPRHGTPYRGPATGDTLQENSKGDQIACGGMSYEARIKLTYVPNQLGQGRKISIGDVFIPIGKRIMKEYNTNIIK